jgi:hypothetical protein
VTRYVIKGTVEQVSKIETGREALR